MTLNKETNQNKWIFLENAREANFIRKIKFN